MNDATNGEVKTIKLTREDIRYIMSEGDNDRSR